MVKLRFIVFGFFAVLAFAGFALFASSELARNEEQALGRRLQAAHEQLVVRERLAAQDDLQLARTAALSAELASAVLQSLPGAKPLPAFVTAGRAAIKPLAEKRVPQEVPSLLAVATAGGAALGKGADAATVVPSAKTLPLLEAALAGNEGTAVAALDGALYRFAAAPVAGRGAAVLVGVPISDSMARALGSVLGADVTFVSEGKVVASTLPEPSRAETLALAASPEVQKPFGPRVALAYPYTQFLPFLPVDVASASSYRGQARKLPGGVAVVLSVPTDGILRVAMLQLAGLGGAAALLLITLGWAFFVAAPLGRHAKALAVFAGRVAVDPKARIETKRTLRFLRPVAEGLNSLGEALEKARAGAGPARGAAREEPAASEPPADEASFADFNLGPQKTEAPAEEAQSDAPPYEEPPAEPPAEEPPAAMAPPEDDLPPPPDEPPPADEPKPAPTLRGRAVRKDVVVEPPPPPDEMPLAAGATQVFRAPLHLAGEKAVPLPPPRSEPKQPVQTAVYAAVNPEPEPEAPAEDPEEQHHREVFKEFQATRTKCGEAPDSISYEGFAAKLKKARDAQVAKGARTVRFQVYVKEGKAALKATPIRD